MRVRVRIRQARSPESLDPMDLLARARAAADGRAQAVAARGRRGGAAAPPCLAEDAIVPYDCVRDALETHPLPYALGASPRAVYAGLAALHRQRGVAPEPAPDAAPEPAPESAPDLPPLAAHAEALLADVEHAGPAHWLYKGGRRAAGACAFCAGHLLLDRAEGQAVCDSCGAVGAAGLNFVPDPKHDDDTPVQQANAASAPPALPPWAAVKYGLVDANPRPFLRDLEHWNQFTHHPRGLLEALDRALVAWPEGDGTPKDARMAAALLYPVLGDDLPRVADARRGGELGVVTVEPEPTHACAGCGAKCHTGKQARLHCGPLARWGQKRRRRL